MYLQAVVSSSLTAEEKIDIMAAMCEHCDTRTPLLGFEGNSKKHSATQTHIQRHRSSTARLRHSYPTVKERNMSGSKDRHSYPISKEKKAASDRLRLSRRQYSSADTSTETSLVPATTEKIASKPNATNKVRAHAKPRPHAVKNARVQVGATQTNSAQTEGFPYVIPVHSPDAPLYPQAPVLLPYEQMYMSSGRPGMAGMRRRHSAEDVLTSHQGDSNTTVSVTSWEAETPWNNKHDPHRNRIDPRSAMPDHHTMFPPQHPVGHTIPQLPPHIYTQVSF